MIVVVTIVIILLGIIFFAGKSLRIRARETQVKSDVRSLSLSLLNYSGQKKGKFPISNKSADLPNGRCFEFLKPNDDLNMSRSMNGWTESDKQKYSPTSYALLKSGVINKIPTNPFYPRENTPDNIGNKNGKQYYYYCSNGQNYQVISRLYTKVNYIFEAKQTNEVAERPIVAPALNFTAVNVDTNEEKSVDINNTETNAPTLDIPTDGKFKLKWNVQLPSGKLSDVVFCKAEGQDPIWAPNSGAYYEMRYDSPAFKNNLGGETESLAAMPSEVNYTISCYGFNGDIDASALVRNIKVGHPVDPDEPKMNFAVLQTDLASAAVYTNQHVSVYWDLENVSGCQTASNPAASSWNGPINVVDDPFKETTFNYPIPGTYIYTLACSTGGILPKTVTITVTDPAPLDMKFEIKKSTDPDTKYVENDITIPQDDFVSLKWDVKEAINCTSTWNGTLNVVDGKTSGITPIYGPILAITSPHTFTLTCEDYAGNTSLLIRKVIVDTKPSNTLFINSTFKKITIYKNQTPIPALTWSSSNDTTSCTTTNDNSDNTWDSTFDTTTNHGGTTVLSPFTTTGTFTYSIQCKNAANVLSDEASVIIEVKDVPTPTVDLQVSKGGQNNFTNGPYLSEEDGFINLKWDVKDALSCTTNNWSELIDPINGIPVGTSKGISGLIGALAKPGPYIYSLACKDFTGIDTSPKTVTVNIDPTPAVSLNVDGQPSVSYYKGNSYVPTLYWSASASAVSCEATGDWGGSRGTSGSEPATSLTVIKTYNYLIQCQNSSGVKSNVASASIVVSEAPAGTISLSANPEYLNSGDFTTISYSVTNMAGCAKSGAWSGGVTVDKSGSSSGSNSDGPFGANETRSYTLTCTDFKGTSPSPSKTVTVTSAPHGPIALDLNPISANVYKNPTTTYDLAWKATGAINCSSGWTSKTGVEDSDKVGPFPNEGINSFTTTCSNADPANTVSKTSIFTVTDPPAATLSLSVSPTAPSPGGFVTVTWSFANVASCTTSWGSPDNISTDTDGPFTSGETRTYTLTCVDLGGATKTATATATATTGFTGPVTVTLTPSSSNVYKNSSTTYTLTWGSGNASECSSGWTSSKAISGSGPVGPFSSAGTYTFITTCSNSTNSNNATATFTVTDPPAGTVTVTAIPANPTPMSTVLVNWSTTDVIPGSCVRSWAGPTEDTSGSYSRTLFPANTSETYTVTCKDFANTSRTGSATAESYVEPTAKLYINNQLEGTATGYTGPGTFPLTWTSTNATSCTLNGSDVAINSGQSVGPFSTAGTYTYTLICKNTAHTSPQSAVSINISVPDDPTFEFDLITLSNNPNTTYSVNAKATNVLECEIYRQWSDDNYSMSAWFKIADFSSSDTTIDAQYDGLSWGGEHRNNNFYMECKDLSGNWTAPGSFQSFQTAYWDGIIRTFQWVPTLADASNFPPIYYTTGKVNDTRQIEYSTEFMDKCYGSWDIAVPLLIPGLGLKTLSFPTTGSFSYYLYCVDKNGKQFWSSPSASIDISTGGGPSVTPAIE